MFKLLIIQTNKKKKKMYLQTCICEYVECEIAPEGRLLSKRIPICRRCTYSYAMNAGSQPSITNQQHEGKRVKKKKKNKSILLKQKRVA